MSYIFASGLKSSCRFLTAKIHTIFACLTAVLADWSLAIASDFAASTFSTLAESQSFDIQYLHGMHETPYRRVFGLLDELLIKFRGLGIKRGRVKVHLGQMPSSYIDDRHLTELGSCLSNTR